MVEGILHVSAIEKRTGKSKQMRLRVLWRPRGERRAFSWHDMSSLYAPSSSLGGEQPNIDPP